MARRRLHVAERPAERAAQLLAEALDAAPPRPRLAIPGGSALRALRPEFLPAWREIRMTWVDERDCPMAHADSNRGAAWRAGLLSRDAPPGLELPLLLDGESFEDARARVETALSLHFDDGLDVLLLGLGEDGHIASLFPGRPWDGPGPLLRVTDSPKPPSSRLTLSLPFLRTASRAILLATGPSKREALLRLLDGDPALPASHLPDLDVVVGLPLSLSLPGASHERIL